VTTAPTKKRRTKAAAGVHRRARSVQDKDARRTALLDAARAALAETGYDEVTVGQVAAGAGVAKGTAYLYFTSKEALFLAVLVRELGDWLDVLQVALARRGSGDPGARVARTLARTLAARPVLIQLLSLLHGRLEPNTPAADILAFKRFLAERLGVSGRAIEAAAGLPEGRGVTLLLRAHALTIGLGSMSDPPAVVREVLAANRELAAFEVDFEKELAAALADMLRGWAAAAAS